MTDPLLLAPEPSFAVPNAAPAITGERIAPGYAGPIPAFGDDHWYLDALGKPPAAQRVGIGWDSWPVALRPTFKRLTYRLINEPTPDILLDAYRSSTVEWASANSIRTYLNDWRQFARWLNARSITTLSEVRPHHLEAWSTAATGTGAYGTQRRRLGSIERLWAVAADDEEPLIMPPWRTEDLPMQGSSNENTTAVIRPDTMAPLLKWALIFVRDLSADILSMCAYVAERSEALSSTPRERGAARVALEGFLETHGAIPTSVHAGEEAPAVRYLALITGVPLTLLSAAFWRMTPQPVVRLNGSQPLPVAVSGRVAGDPWVPHMDYRELLRYRHALTGACLVIIGYLTGMRPQEVLALQNECSEATVGPDGVDRYRVRGRKFKRVRREGNQDHTGTERSWETLQPVHEAILVMQQLLDGPFLLPSSRDPLRPMDTGDATSRIRTLTALANDICEANGLPDAYRIPDDRSGPVTMRRFRRTLAWHIRRRPGGNVALAIQYGHLTLRQGEGYAGLKQVGMMELLDREEASAIIDTLHDLRDKVDQGEGLSGFAVPRLIRGIEKAERFQGGFLSLREIRHIQRDGDLQIYDNPGAFVICVFQAATAECGGISAPELAACQQGCVNGVRTDSQMDGLRRYIASLRSEASNPLTPEPLRLRLEERADRYQHTIDRHTASRVRPGE